MQDYFTNQKLPQEFKLDEITTILWTKEMGRRMSLARMKRNEDQAELALRLGLTQGAVSKLETGKTHVCETLTVAKLRIVFSEEFNFIFFAKGAIRWNEQIITKTYWDKRLRQQRVNRSKYSKSRLI